MQRGYGLLMSGQTSVRDDGIKDHRVITRKYEKGSLDQLGRKDAVCVSEKDCLICEKFSPTTAAIATVAAAAAADGAAAADKA